MIRRKDDVPQQYYYYYYDPGLLLFAFYSIYIYMYVHNATMTMNKSFDMNPELTFSVFFKLQVYLRSRSLTN